MDAAYLSTLPLSPVAYGTSYGLLERFRICVAEAFFGKYCWARMYGSFCGMCSFGKRGSSAYACGFTASRPPLYDPLLVKMDEFLFNPSLVMLYELLAFGFTLGLMYTDVGTGGAFLLRRLTTELRYLASSRSSSCSITKLCFWLLRPSWSTY